jgi:hypothetical protein
MFKRLVNSLKKALSKSMPKQSNPVLAKVQEEVVQDLLAKADEVAEIADKAAENIEKEIVEAVKEVKKKGRPSNKSAAQKKKPSTKKTA